MRRILILLAVLAVPVQAGEPPLLEVVPAAEVRAALAGLKRSFARELKAREDYIHQLEEALDSARTLDRNCGA